MIKVILFMLFKPDQPKYWQTLLNNDHVYGVCMNLHVEFVRVASSFAWIITSILTQIQIASKDQTKAKIFNCKWGDSCMFCSITVALVMTKRLISFLNLPDLFAWKVI